LVGNNGSITDHSKSVKSNRAISISSRRVNQIAAALEILFMGM
jgi:hypothetical protein